MQANIPKDNKKLEKYLEETKIKLEEALSEKKHLFEKINYLEEIINLIPGHVYWKNRAGIYQGCNGEMAKRLKLISNNEIIGKTVFELIPNHKELAEKACQEDEQIMTSNQRKNFEEEGLDAQDNPAVFMTNKVLLRDMEGKVKGLIGISLDITKQKQAHIAKQEFLQNMAHDLRTPLAGIIGLAQLQEMGLETLEESQEYGEMIHGAGNQLLELLNAVIKIIDTKHMTDPVKTETLDLSALAKEMQALMLPSMLSKELQFQLKLDESLPIVLSDRIKLKRILINLLSNAVKFTKAGEVSLDIKLLSIEDTQANVKISVSDTGIGMAQDTLDKIFDRFYRAHPSYLGEYSGFGLGLHLVKEGIKELHGEIKVYSEEGQGSQFVLHFKFPLAHKDLNKTENTRSLNKLIHKGSVLLAEDNALVRYAVKNLLEDIGYEVEEVVDGKAALEVLKSKTFRWALLDMGLPQIKGTEVCKQYRQWEKEMDKSHLPIFVLTGHSVEEVSKECKEAGVDKVFTKPLSQKIVHAIEVLSDVY